MSTEHWKMEITGPEGHEELEWTQQQVDTVEAAEARFAAELLNGMLPVKNPGTPEAEVTREWDPRANWLLGLPMAGG